MEDLGRLRSCYSGVLGACSVLADRRRIAPHHDGVDGSRQGALDAIGTWQPACARRRSRFVTSRRAAVRPSNAHALGVNASSAPRSPIGTWRSVNILDVAHRLTTSSSRQPATLPHRAGAQKPHRSCPSDARPSTTGLAGERALRREQSSGHHRASRRRHHATSAGACARERRDESCNTRLSRQASDAVPMSRRGRPSAPRTGVHLCDLFRPFAFGQQIDEPSASRVTCCRRLLWRSRRAHRARRGPTAWPETTTRRRRTSRPTIAADARTGARRGGWAASTARCAAEVKMQRPQRSEDERSRPARAMGNTDRRAPRHHRYMERDGGMVPSAPRPSDTRDWRARQRGAP